jgi:hypothetical protein
MPVQSEIRSVFADTQAPAVSIFLPTHRAGPEIEQDPIRLKNLIKRAEEQLIAEGSRPAVARDLLAPVSELVGNAAFWRHQSEGLAVFRSPAVLQTQRLPFPVREFVSVSDRFYIKPLLPLLLDDVRFYVLALSQQAVRLLECTRNDATPVALPEVPQGMEEALPEGPAPQLQLHSLPLAGQSAARFHGHGVGADDADVVNLTRYFHRVKDGLQQILKEERAPLILACVEYLAPIFKEVSGYRPILDPIVAGNPDGLKDEELHRKAWPLAESYFAQRRDKAVAEYQEGAAKGRAAHELADVLAGAFQGRVATLFVPLGVRRWGRFDFDRLALEEHEREQAGDDELLDLAALQTLRHGGMVYGMTPEDMPDRRLLAAVYRY